MIAKAFGISSSTVIGLRWREVGKTHTQEETLAMASAVHASKTHCPKGHPYAGENLAIYNGKRHCRECARMRSRASARPDGYWRTWKQ